MINLSIVSPIYRAENIIPTLISEIKKYVNDLELTYEIILVNDGSPDDSWSIIRSICMDDEKVKGVNLSRNFGQQHAIQAGLEAAQGDYIVVMDCDLQDRPEEIGTLYNKILEGSDIVVASRVDRQDGLVKKLASRMFNRLISFLTDTVQDSSVANFFILTRQVADTLCSIKDKRRYYPLLLQWVGFTYTKVSIAHASRADERSSSYSFKKRLMLALDTILTFSEKPLRLTLIFGILLSLFSSLIGVILVGIYLFSDLDLPGWSTLVLLICFLSGVIISVLGVIGIYVGMTFETTKDRPTYIIQEMIN